MDRSGWLRFTGVFSLVAALGGCSSSSSASPPSSNSPDAEANGTSDGAVPIPDASPVTCDAGTLAPMVDAAAVACFQCQAAQCAAETAACASDCTCGPAYGCLEENAAPGALNSGYSACSQAVDAITNGNVALMNLADCAAAMCSPQCFGGNDGG